MSSLQVGPESVGASEGFLGWIAYLGAANAGIPLSIIVKNYGWEVRRAFSRQEGVQAVARHMSSELQRRCSYVFAVFQTSMKPRTVPVPHSCT